MLDKARVEEILIDADVLLNGHFILTSGKHSDKYMQCAKILQYPHYAQALCAGLAEEFKNDRIDAVIAPAIGGIIIGYEIARQLGAKNLFAERENDVMTLRRGFTLEKGARVLVAEDVVTTGGSVFDVMQCVRDNGGEVAGVALLVDRSNGKVDFGVKTAVVYTADVVSYDAADCPLCKEGKQEAYKPGSRKTVS
ncbi:MAG: orotate phosphoribosyltransferase [Clostridiales bacterium]|jgi:orotate phosphoribosyltransferase|nr:orotate phosphoribosyltransferase [Clostridiales bacterium]